jgi:DivIVA domain-containing protein
MIDLTPLDVRKKKGDFRRAVRGYDHELVDDFLDIVAELLEELVKQNEALVTAQQLRTEAQAQADREADLVRREAQSQAERIVEEGQRSLRELARQIETLQTRKAQFVRAFRTLLERYYSELELEEERREESRPAVAPPPMPSEPPPEVPEEKIENSSSDWLSSLVAEREQEEAT